MKQVRFFPAVAVSVFFVFGAVTGFAAAQFDSPPSGYTQENKIEGGVLTVTTYVGTATVQEANATFRLWMENQGWAYQGEGGLSGYTGQIFMKVLTGGNEAESVVQVTSGQAGQVSVAVTYEVLGSSGNDGTSDGQPTETDGLDFLIVVVVAGLVIAVMVAIIVYHRKIMGMVEKETRAKPRRKKAEP